MLLFVVLAAMVRVTGARRMPVWANRLALFLSLAAVWIPIHGLPLHRWVAGVVPGFSIPLLALMLHAALRGLGREGFLRALDLRSLGSFVMVAGVIFYPLALGWGSWDPYALGWGSGVLFGMGAALSALLLVRRIRLGWVLMAAILAWHLQALESTNYWDYLLDPLLFLLSPVLVLWKARGGKPRPVTVEP
jgi:hypothetical protein